MTLHCKKCNQQLTEALWRDQGEYFIPCFGCGVRNIVQPMLQIVGYREEIPFPKRRRSSSRPTSPLSVPRGRAMATKPSRVSAGSGPD